MEDQKPTPFADLISGLFWLALAAAIVIGSWRMDRLAHLKVSIYTVPGLVPGILGIAIALFATALLIRALRAGALADARLPAIRLADHWRLITALVLCLVFAAGIVGSGIPFWVGAAAFVAVAVFVFQYPERRASGTLPRGALIAVAHGVISGFAIHYVFQELFLVRLP
jgi:hypothetical protein